MLGQAAGSPAAKKPWADVPGVLPPGTPVPADGVLPPVAAAELGQRPFGFYVHVPFCQRRCGYCDFNTYTAAELGPGVSRDTYPALAAAEVRLARRVLGDAAARWPRCSSAAVPRPSCRLSQLGEILRVIEGEFGLAPGAEVTVEANPESVDEESLAALRAAGFTRISLGMQSAAPHVLAVLDRVHEPGRPARCAQWAREAGFEHVSLDLIYGTPGETDADWRESLEAALAAGPDHISAYALIVEEGTRLAAQVRRGEVAVPDDEAMADRYLAADELLSARGLGWYEVSNWGAGPAARCQHNLLYWTGGHWWGVGPGAHSHVGGVRWWNVKHPAAYAARLTAGTSPGLAREVLTGPERRLEEIMLLTRLACGCPVGAARPGRAGRRRHRGGGRAGRGGRLRRGPGRADHPRAAARRRRHPRPHRLTPARPGPEVIRSHRGSWYISPRPAAAAARITTTRMPAHSSTSSGTATSVPTVAESRASTPPTITMLNVYRTVARDRLSATTACARANLRFPRLVR